VEKETLSDGRQGDREIRRKLRLLSPCLLVIFNAEFTISALASTTRSTRTSARAALWPIVSDTAAVRDARRCDTGAADALGDSRAAVVRLRDAGMLDPTALDAADTSALAALIRPCAFRCRKRPACR